MAADLFDMKLRALRRGRSDRQGPELFLFERAFNDILERIELLGRKFERAMLIGYRNPEWLTRLHECVERVDLPSDDLVEDDWDPPSGAFDLVVALGTLDTVNALPLALQLFRRAMRPDGLFIGALSGGDTLPQLRAAMRAADEVQGVAVPHVHPRIEAASLAPLLSAAGFMNPVVDVDRVRASYESLERLVADLRAMGATNILTQRSRRPLAKAARDAAIQAFAAAGEDGRTTETFEILHFAAWTPSESATGMPGR